MRLGSINTDLVLHENLEKKLPYLTKALEKWLSWQDIKEDEDPAAYVEEVIENIAAADPIAVKSGNRKTPFVNQILKWFLSEKIRLPEDIQTVKEILTQYNELKHHKGFNHEIEEFGSPGNLRKAIAEFTKKPEEGKYNLPVVFDNGDVKVYQIDEFDPVESHDKDSIIINPRKEMVHKDFISTGWCVKHEHFFNQYKPPYFMAVDAKTDKRLALIHVESHQIKDVHDDPIRDIELLKRLFPLVTKFWPSINLRTLLRSPAAYPDLMPFSRLMPGWLEEVSRDYQMAYGYARSIGNRFPEGEKVIASNPITAYSYARYIIQGRWPEGEKAIATGLDTSFNYAKDIIGGRFPEGEKVIAKNPRVFYEYAQYVVKGRVPEYEDMLINDPLHAYYYTKNVVHDRWPIAEKAIINAFRNKSPIKSEYGGADLTTKDLAQIAFDYAYDVVGGRWPEGEEVINSDPKLAERYVKFVETGSKLLKQMNRRTGASFH